MPDESLHHEHAQLPEQRLWRWVIIQAVKDALKGGSKDANDAALFLKTPADASLACDLAGIDYGWLMEKYRALASNPEKAARTMGIIKKMQMGHGTRRNQHTAGRQTERGQAKINKPEKQRGKHA